MMNDSRVRRARELFDQLLELPREDRESFLRDACDLDQLLEEEIRSLLEAHQEAEGFLESEQVARALAGLSSGEDDPLVGTVIGDYWILGLLGRGGMGAVYRAEQVHPHREVALKLIDRGFASPELLRRFEVEAEVLARLQHPGIAQIHVAGTAETEHGKRPYFAMELVEGLPLTAFADEADLDRRERLELLIRVCEAVQHAHQVGVIHRDLKPANILVTAEGQPKVLDFGIARSTEADLQVTTVADGQAALVGTLPYMSPEQVRGDPDQLDTRSDVHALGVLCYELLTGQLPRMLEGKPLTDAIRTIVDEEPRTLRAATKTRFPADLETIVAKALESDRHRRYDSASGLAADLRRYLDGQPISARPASAIYQLNKLVARNRLPVVLVAGLVLLAVVSAVVMGFQTRRTAQERDRAGVEAVTATAVSGFLESLFLQADPEQALGETLTAREILDRGAERVETELQDQPAVRGRLLALLGKVYESLGERDRAAPLLEEAVDIGRTLQRVQEGPADRSNLRLALCLLARCRGVQGRHDEAIALCREAVELSEAVYGDESALYAICLNHLVHHLTLVSAYDEALALNERALDLRERLLGPIHLDVGWSVFQYAHLLRARGDEAGACEQFERAHAIWTEALPEDHPLIARCLLDFSQSLGDVEEYDLALEHAHEALSMRRRTLGQDHPAIADTQNDIGYLYWRIGDFSEAHRHFSAAVETHKNALGPGDRGVLSRLYTLAYVNDRRKRLDEKEAVLREALDLARTYHADSPGVVGEAAAKLGLYYGNQRRDADARPLIEEATELLEQADDSYLGILLSVRSTLAHVLGLEDEASEALELSEQILAMLLEHPELKGSSSHLTKWNTGVTMVRLKMFEDAEAHFQELLVELERTSEPSSFFPWSIRWQLGHCRYGLGDEDGARALYDAVLKVDQEILSDHLFWLRLRRAEDHAAEGRLDDARRELRASFEAGLDTWSGRMALLANPRLQPDVRQELLREIDER